MLCLYADTRVGARRACLARHRSTAYVGLQLYGGDVTGGKSGGRRRKRKRGGGDSPSYLARESLESPSRGAASRIVGA
jgi:hypothetical protein